MKTNLKIKSTPAFTHEGAKVRKDSPLRELRRSLMACMLFENTFYEKGSDHATRMAELIRKVSFEEAAEAAIEAREKFKLRHAPLFVVRELLRNHSGRKVGDLIYRVIQRADECAELLALYWKEKADAPLSSQLKIGLARALKKFNEYELAKWDNGAIKLRDVMFLTHANPAASVKGAARFTKAERKRASKFDLTEREKLFARMAAGELKTPDTWEVGLSAGADKNATFERLISEEKLGALALLRNLRGMTEAGVDVHTIRAAIQRMNVGRILPFRFITAAKHAPQFEDVLEQAMFKCVAEKPKLTGTTVVLVDHSGSMDAPITGKTEIQRFDAATALAMILRELCEHVHVFGFSTGPLAQVPPRRGFGLREAIRQSPTTGGTQIGEAVKYANMIPHDRLIVLTDEQSADPVGLPRAKGYMVNVATYASGVGHGNWETVNGFSEALIDYIQALESETE